MYRVKVSYSLNEDGQVFACLTCTKADKGSDRNIFYGSDTIKTNPYPNQDYEAVQQEIHTITTDANMEINRRRQLPDGYEYEV